MATAGCWNVAGIVFVVWTLFQVCEGTGTMELYVNRFQGDCSDNSFLDHECDTYFKFCLDRQRTPNVNWCQYLRKRTSHYHNDNAMDFDSQINGVDNPLVASVTSFQTNGNSDVMFAMEAWDKDSATSDDHYASLSVNLSYTPASGKGDAIWKSDYIRKNSNHVWFKYRFYCDAYYYTHKCNVRCQARDDDQGHYTCIPGTGQKKCMRGWKGENCDIDMDECSRPVCYHNATCTNQPGHYECSCPQGYAGQNCDLVDSLCHSTPCQHDGTCTGTMEEYTCTCHFQWTGTNCETQVDFCQSNPCQNNATCYATVGNYTCACAPGWTGYHCTTEVDACDSAPCDNGGSCTKKPQAGYDCTCPAQYEGKNCTTLKDPCDPSPCLNSGTCEMLTYDTYNCSCVYGWVGEDCDSYRNVTAESQQQSDGDGGDVNVLPILIGILAAFIIILIILAILFIRRRRRQKEDLEAGAQNGDLFHNGNAVQHVAAANNLAFRNALYDQTNRANSDLETCSARPPLPVPTPLCAAGCEGGVFNFTKPKVVLGEEEEGAVGGCNPYQDIDGYQTPSKCSVDGGAKKAGGCAPNGEAGLDTRTLAGDRNHYDDPRDTGANHYADFEDLKRRSVTVKEEASGYANTPEVLERMEEAEENHYHDLDDLHLDIITSDPDPFTSDPDPFTSDPDPFTSDPDPFSPPFPDAASHYDSPRSARASEADPFTSDPDPFSPPDPAATSHYDAPRSSRSSRSSDVTPSGSDATASGNDLTIPANQVGGGYMAMAGTTLREVQLDTLDSSDEEGVDQEDIDKLRQEVMQNSVTQSFA